MNRTIILHWVRASLLGAAYAWALEASAQTVPYNGTRGAPRTNATATWSQVIARSTGRAADLFVDGRALCRLPCQVAVPSGVHSVVGRGPEGSSAEQRLYFPPGAAVPVLLDIAPARALLRVSAAVAGTLIYVDGVQVGNTNWQGAIPAGTHRIQLRRPSGEQVVQDLTVTAGMTYNIRDNVPQRPATARAQTIPTTPAPRAAPITNARSPAVPPASRVNGHPQARPEYPQPVAGASPAGYGSPAPETESPPEGDSAERDRYRGMTSSLLLPIIVGGPSTNDYVDHCPATAFAGSCSAGGPRGATILGRIGYAFGWIAPELTAGLALDLSSGGLHLPSDAKIEGDRDGILTEIAAKTKFLRVGILGAFGVRVASTGRSARFSLSGSFGLVKRHVYVLPDSFFGQKPTYTAKTLFFDAGVLLGDTPGAKFHAGLFAWFEFVPSLVIERDVARLGLTEDLVPASLRRVTPFSGTQLMFGPFIGVTFGH